MGKVGQKERKTQNRIMRFLTDPAGPMKYRNLGNWEDRANNANIEEEILRKWLEGRGRYSPGVISKALYELGKAASVGGNKTLYDANREVYSLLRYGVKVSPDTGNQKITVELVDWKQVEENDFAVAEEVAISGVHDKRPDIVIYVNGIAMGVLELKRSTVSVAQGIRQNLDSQKPEFIRHFFSTVQLVMAANDTEGLRYGVIETTEKYFLQWKERGSEERGGGKTDRLESDLTNLCRPERFLEVIHDFVVFDAGTKKTCRHNQYFGIRAAQVAVGKREGGIIWHTQGSGKSLTMVWLAKWIRENVPNSRVLLITDRTELDEQIEKVFRGVEESIYRTKSGADLVRVLNESDQWLMCSLVHKFGTADEGDVDEYVEEIRKSLPKGFVAKGDLFIFVDECHRTQSGKLHQSMKAILPGAMLIGFTGTPLLKRDKQRSIEIFGPYIHTYKYDEAVRDGVVLDLRYEARDVDQRVTSQDKIDQWFEVKTKGLNDFAKAQLKRRWGTMQKVLSSKSRLDKIATDILFDMETRPRLVDGHGNAILVADSVYAACRYYEFFSCTDLGGKCAIVTSYRPVVAAVKGEDAGAGQNESLLKYKVYRKMLADYFGEPEDVAAGKAEQFEQEVKKRFINEPGQMKLLIVVAKLLTGFDAPPATYLYIDQRLQDHGLFQAICRVNRLDGEGKDYGYIIDYMDLFESLGKSFHDYTGGAFDEFDKEDVADLLKDRLTSAREHLDEAREALKALCEPVEPPKDSAAYLRYFVGKADADGEEVEENESKRAALYKLVTAFERAFVAIANELSAAGYTPADEQLIREDVEHFENVRKEVKLASGDYIDMKMYEPAMRHMLDTYLHAEDSKTISKFDDLSLVELFAEQGAAALDLLPQGIKQSEDAVAETIENNVRRLIIDESAVNPRYYEKMSELLQAIIEDRRKKAIDYAEFLKRVRDLCRKIVKPEEGTSYPSSMSTGLRRALYDNLGQDVVLVLKVDAAIEGARMDGWRGDKLKEKKVKKAIEAVLGDQDPRVSTVLGIARGNAS